jgi:hypothetical protein
VKAHSHDAAPLSHQRRRRARQLSQGICTDFQSGDERIALDFHVFTFQRFTRSEGDAVNQEIQPTKFFTNSLKRRVHFFLLSNIAREERRFRHFGRSEALDIVFEPLALISERETGAGAVQGLRRGPRNRSFVGHTKNNSLFIFKHIGSLTSILDLTSELNCSLLCYVLEAECINHGPHRATFELIGDKLAVGISIFEPGFLRGPKFSFLFVVEGCHEFLIDLIQHRISRFVSLARALGHFSLRLRISARVAFLAPLGRGRETP